MRLEPQQPLRTEGTPENTQKATADGNVPPLAAPARYDDLSGLPPAWIGVGTNDLFHDEDATYARRLHQAGVACTVRVAPGAYHNFDSMEPKTAISQAFVQAQITALDEALNGPLQVLPSGTGAYGHSADPDSRKSKSSHEAVR
ncbi:alpha/beta hydrolase fold domain-containing protein [Arthrobacter pascens]|uniref:alpha/beta hydrolase fold domain-containing protein n=1 Tax=Arthrobacter pascens TaxID=1677 RepID=UPI0027D81B4A|nr:alpha/beta hydrolase fold domain-containing protein [Arthrobacter pascens]